MEKLKNLTRSLVTECEKFTLQSGRLTNVFKNIAMQEIKSLESKIIEHNDIDNAPHTVHSLLFERNNLARERGGYIIGEIFKRGKINVNTKKELLGAINKAILDKSLIMPDSILREYVNALGKSGESANEFALFNLLDSKEAKRIRMFILVAIGKIGSEKSINPIYSFSKRPDLRVSDIMFVIWAFGKLAGADRPSGVIPRKYFKSILNFLNNVLKSSTGSDQIYLFCLFAIGEICDQRTLSKFSDRLDASEIEKTIKNINYFSIRFEKTNSKNRYKISSLTKAILEMLKGGVLSEEQERILLEIRNLLDINFDNIGNANERFIVDDKEFDVDTLSYDSFTNDDSSDSGEHILKEKEKKGPDSVRDFFK